MQYDGILTTHAKKQKRSNKSSHSQSNSAESTLEEVGADDGEGLEQGGSSGVSQLQLTHQFVKSFTLERLFSYVSVDIYNIFVYVQL